MLRYNITALYNKTIFRFLQYFQKETYCCVIAENVSVNHCSSRSDFTTDFWALWNANGTATTCDTYEHGLVGISLLVRLNSLGMSLTCRKCGKLWLLISPRMNWVIRGSLVNNCCSDSLRQPVWTNQCYVTQKGTVNKIKMMSHSTTGNSMELWLFILFQLMHTFTHFKNTNSH